jgi:hypothetical protein
MKKLFWLSGSLLVLALVGGCATSSETNGANQGRSEKTIARNHFEVTFTGNKRTSAERATDFCLMRCAEITLEHDFHYLTIVTNRSSFAQNSDELPLYSTPAPGTKPFVTKGFVCLRDKPQVVIQYFEAETLLDTLRSKFHIAKKGVTKHVAARIPRATLGIRFKAIPGTSRSDVILRLTDGSFAAKAGLRPGDRILAYNDVLFSDEPRVQEEINRWEPNEPVLVRIEREGTQMTVPVKAVANSWAIGLQLRPGVPTFTPTDPDDIRIFFSRPHFEAVTFATRVEWENPFTTVEEFQKFALLEAARLGADGILILTNHATVTQFLPNANPNAGFAVYAIKIPRARLGFLFEPTELARKKYVIRRFVEPEAQVGNDLKIGDTIVSINGIDLLNNLAVVMDQLTWRVGQTLHLGVVRDGQEKSIEVSAVPNIDIR